MYADFFVVLQSIARHLRKRRFENGALRIDNVKVNFQLDENGIPEDCSMFERKEANELIEEVRQFVLVLIPLIDDCFPGF